MRLTLLTALVLAVFATGCGANPAEPGRGPAPSAASSTAPPPRATVRDVAVLVPADQLEPVAGLDELDSTVRIVTPSATVTVEAAAVLDLLPPGVLTDDDAELRPADGQTVRAWLLTVAAPPQLAPEPEPRLPDADGARPRDASTTLWLDTGAGRIPVSPPDRHGDEPLVRCDELPCPVIDAERHVLIASLDAAAEPGLVATVDGADQRLDLLTGAVASDVSQVAHTRPATSSQVGIDWHRTTLPVRTEAQLEDEFGTGAGDLTRGGVDVVYGGQVSAAFLSPFDRVNGWAPAGRAWLVAAVEDHLQQPGGEWQAELSADSWTLTYDGRKATPVDGAGSAGAVVFLVDDDLTSATLAYRPSGTVRIRHPDVSYPFRATAPLTADIALP